MVITTPITTTTTPTTHLETPNSLIRGILFSSTPRLKDQGNGVPFNLNHLFLVLLLEM